jgi:glucose-1-phosphate thymidylyltransferase
MKGIIAAGGYGTRLLPITKVTNKHLLPVYNKPLIYYPLSKLTGAGIEEIMIIIGPENAGHFLNLLGSGRDFGCTFTFEIQQEAGGIAQAVAMAEHFADGDDVAVILGDNIFEDDFSDDIHEFQGGAKIFLKEVSDAQRFGVATVEGDKVIEVIEKPAEPKTNLAVTGSYIYDNTVFDIIKNLQPSGRGELEITDVQNEYIARGQLGYRVLDGHWTDAGTFESLHRANIYAREMELGSAGAERMHQGVSTGGAAEVAEAAAEVDAPGMKNPPLRLSSRE